MSDKITSKVLNFKGKLITAVDGSLIGENFKVLQNLRYTDGGVRGVGGMTKINSSALSNPKIRNMFHFRKSQPSESHLLVQAYDSGETASGVFQNTTAIPNTGNFSATALYTDASGASRGRFSDSALGEAAYCNSKEACIWGGTEFRCSKFINYDPSDSSVKFDYTDAVTNASTSDVATLNTSSGIDSNTVLMLHFNNNVTDSSPTTPHTVTINGSTSYSTTKVFGSHSLLFSGGHLTIPDNADFDFSGGTFTIDARYRVTSLAANRIIYYQATDANNYMKVYISTTGAVVVSIYDTGSEVVGFSTANSVITTNTFYHIALVENGDDWYIFVDGVQKAYTSDANRAANYTGDVYIGSDTSTVFSGQIDEFRISNIARYTSDFEIPDYEYTTSTASYIYLGSLRPLKGFKLYVQTANTETSTLSAYYWSGTAWVAVSTLSDGTASAGKALAQTGDVTFDTTVSVAEPKIIDEAMLYWYKIAIDAVSVGTSIYRVTVDAPFQTIKDLWDGDLRIVTSFQVYQSSTYNDYTVNVFEEDYNSSTASTYAQIGSLATSGYLAVGFTEPIMGIRFSIVDGAANTSATTATVSYWNGEAWVSVGTVDDGTVGGGKTFNKSGTISWKRIANTSEFKKEISKKAPLYYYKISFNSTLSSNVRVDYISGIPSPKTIGAYKFPLFSGNRLFLCSNSDKDKNSALVSSKFTSGVFNGVDSDTLYFGDDEELTAAATLYSQFGSNLYNIAIFTKYNQTWMLSGDGPDDWSQYQISDNVGCAAPLTMQVVNLGSESVPGGQNRHVAIWQGSEGIYLFDGKTLKPIHDDIEDWFNINNSYSINRSKITDSVSFIDTHNQEYHWLFASGDSTTLNKELVFDVKRMRWYEIVRGTPLQCGVEVADTSGSKYTYGAINTGYVERLEYGNTFDSTAIAHRVQFGDMILAGLDIKSEIRKLKLITVSKTNTANSVTGAHYGDSNATSTAFTLPTVRSGYGITNTVRGASLGPNVFHSIDLRISTTNETVGFEPLYLMLLFRATAQDWS